MLRSGSPTDTLPDVREHFRSAGMRWTPQRRLILQVLDETDGHVTGSELVDRCRSIDPGTTPSTVYRTLRALEDVGLVRHAHGLDGREEFHVRPGNEHGHLHCGDCGSSWEIGPDEAAATIEAFRRARGFDVDLSHLTVVGRCRSCVAGAAKPSGARS
ncbi:MAG TPA: Fur family transcriptional regulator [Candidatus Limnocylindrales bacterium]|nr:Fur family transcriptional regulator [Candidatus Limnocylindrales bacterium]